jgi:hypothetical protein
VTTQLWALAVAGIVVLAAVCLELVRAARARRAALICAGAPSPEPYILYFTGEGCTVCRTHQEPALAKLGDVRIDRVDAIAEKELSEQFHVYTLPTTVVMCTNGKALYVNYGYASARKLESQLADARNGVGAIATA